MILGVRNEDGAEAVGHNESQEQVGLQKSRFRVSCEFSDNCSSESRLRDRMMCCDRIGNLWRIKDLEMRLFLSLACVKPYMV